MTVEDEWLRRLSLWQQAGNDSLGRFVSYTEVPRIQPDFLRFGTVLNITACTLPA